MNQAHRTLCASDLWGDMMRDQILPWAFDGLDPEACGERLIEIGPGPGKATEHLRTMTDQLTAVELDPALADDLRARFAGSNVEVFTHDATALPFADGHFTAGVCFTMLHHVPTAELQDRLLAELVRVVEPGGLVVGSDSVASEKLADLHVDDTYNPIASDGLPERLRRAGLVGVQVTTNEFAFRFRGRVGA